MSERERTHQARGRGSSPAHRVRRPDAVSAPAPWRDDPEDWNEAGEGVAHLAAFVREGDRAYLVRDLDGGHLVAVPKRYAVAEPFLPIRRRQAPGARLLRWSAYALFAALCGGLGGILLGVLVTLLAAIQLGRFALRVRRWRLRHRRSNGAMLLPAAAGAERLRLITAWAQGLLAVIVGAALLAFLLWHLL